MVLVALAAMVIVIAAGVSSYYATHTRPLPSGSSGCSDPDSISSHVYNSYRLNVIKSCITASGVVENVFEDADGDYHVCDWLSTLSTAISLTARMISTSTVT